MSVSRTVPRLVDVLSEPEVPAPRVVGVEEHATRKGRHCGTVLMDVETRRPIDLLPDREATSLAAWLAQRPGDLRTLADEALARIAGDEAGPASNRVDPEDWKQWRAMLSRLRAVLVPPPPSTASFDVQTYRFGPLVFDRAVLVKVAWGSCRI
ncbi:hypothetical protein ABZ079_33355 [Streptomyces sp. NPDC006314]|uniref:hypothetical protein n=1 Tax=Streptomyces sp. NPDC006314 TaxID=3154475 RepID=UPI0033B6CAE4